MLKFFPGWLKNKEGFTLVEIIIVIAILGTLAVIAVPQVGKFRIKAAISAHNVNVRTLEGAATMYVMTEGLPEGENTENITWKRNQNNDIWENYITNWPDVPKGLKELLGSKNTDDGEYKVEITKKDEVTVSPGIITEDDISENGGSGGVNGGGG